MTPLVARSIDGKIRMHDGDVFFSEEDDDTPCKCCALECEEEVTITVTFCGMTAERTLPIPGILDGNQFESLPDGSYLIVSAQISCGPCGWDLSIGVCAFCVATDQAASDGFTGVIPFADNPAPGGGYCPKSGAVDLTCFGDQFGIPCVTNPTASVG